MDFNVDQYAIPGEDLDIDLTLAQPDTASASATSSNNFRDSMLELEQSLDEQTRDISSRFQSERRPEPAGLDRALDDNYGRSNQRSRVDTSAQQRYASKSGGFVTGFDPLSKEEQAKKANRAQRFGALPQEETQNKDIGMDEQGASMDVDDGEWIRPDNLPETPPRTSTIRLEAVHLYGTDEMSTKDVLSYFDAYGPSHVEWIDDSSCNIVFPDQFSAKRALYFQLVNRDVDFGEEAENDVEPSRTESVTPADESGIPAAVVAPKSNNRLQRAKDYIPVQQQNHPIIQSNKGLFVRYATDYDRKERGAAARSTYYAIHGREEARSAHTNNSLGSSRYGRRSRADDDEIWNRGRGITSFSRLRRKMENGGESPSPSPTRRRSWSRNRRLGGSISRSRSRSRSRGGSRSPGSYSSRRDHASLSPDSNSRMRSDDYEKRGRRGDISLRLGGRAKFPDAADEEVAETRLNQYADDFLAELESSFSRREKAIPKTRMYSDFYEREILSEVTSDSRLGSDGGRDRRDSSRNDNRRRRRDDVASFTGASSSASPRGRRDHRREREDALKAMESRLGLPSDDHVDEFGRSRRS
ncbi:hypothetical protein BGX21_009806 [Mortierella sp. AD011]|nr:hypothetical protein BGX20_006944 [Mortierella sp. AD010]KAF9395701.1 hypothetical protein BGX21_009806 [Mortierella sp. AD011]